jgi:actin-related protein 8
MEVLINAKGISADETTWKGAAILSCLGSAQELWINPKEWNRNGQKLLREKTPFPWA